MTHYQPILDVEILRQLFVGNSQDPGVARLLILQVQAQEQLGPLPMSGPSSAMTREMAAIHGQ